MTIHRSLKLKSALKRSRNVWTRIERMAELAKTGEWDSGKSVFGLRKVRTGSQVRKKK
jgi:small basic protein (TIGR04137 family)